MIRITIRPNEGTGSLALSYNDCVSDAVEFVNEILHHSTKPFSIYIEYDVCDNDCDNCHLKECTKRRNETF